MSRSSVVAKWNIDGGKFIDRFAAELQFKAVQVYEDEAIRAVGATMQNTPIHLQGDAGKLLANWQIARKINSRVIKTQNKGKARGFAEKKLRGKFAVVNRQGIRSVSDKSMFFFNNSPYARVVEFGGYPKPVKVGTWIKKEKRFRKLSRGGFSKLAPKGMLRISVANMRLRLRKRLKNL